MKIQNIKNNVSTYQRIQSPIKKSSRSYVFITHGRGISIYTCDEELLVPKDNEILSKKHWFNDSLIELWMRW